MINQVYAHVTMDTAYDALMRSFTPNRLAGVTRIRPRGSLLPS